MALFQSSQLVQFLHAGHVVSSSGVWRSCFNVFTYHTTLAAAYVTTNKTAFVTRFSSQVSSIIYPLLSTRYIGDSVGTWLVNQPGDAFGFLAFASSGAVAGDCLPLPCAVFQSFDTTFRGLRYKGKKYWGAIPTSYVVGDELTAAALSTFHTISNRVLGRFGVTCPQGNTTFNPVCWSRVLSLSTPPPAAQWVSDLQTGSTCKVLSSWRHRRERVVR